MNDDAKSKSFHRQIKRGREFEKWERSQWKGGINDSLESEAPTQWNGKRGRMDIRLYDTEEGHTVIVELKATQWDKIKPHRVRPNALRHARQIWRYIEAELKENHSVLPAICYPAEPKTPGRKEVIEGILDDQGIQVVWRPEAPIS
jgi:hypothetical protein